MKRRFGFTIAGLTAASLAGGLAVAGEPAALDSLGAIVLEMGGKQDTAPAVAAPVLQPRAIVPTPKASPVKASAPEAAAICQSSIAASTLMRLDMSRKVADKIADSSVVFDRQVVDVLGIEAEALRAALKSMTHEAMRLQNEQQAAIAAITTRLHRIEGLRAMSTDLEALAEQALALEEGTVVARKAEVTVEVSVED